MRGILPVLVGAGVAMALGLGGPVGWAAGQPAAQLLAPAPGATQTMSTAADPNPLLSIDAAAFLLVDLVSGQVLVERAADVRRAPASTTKVLTALLALELGHPDDRVVVSERAARTPGTSGGLIAGETHRLADLVAALILESANDAAVALAEHLSGSEAAFAGLMTRRAAELGALASQFQTASGLDSRRGELRHYSTARDMAVIARAAMARPEFRHLAASPSLPFGERTLQTLNQFLIGYAGATGIKNGWTPRAGYTLIASARRGNMELLAVVLGAPDRDALYTTTARLMDYGFATFGFRQVVAAGQRLGALPYYRGSADSPAWVVAGRAAGVFSLAGTVPPAVSRRVEWRSDLPLAVVAGDEVGYLVLMADGEPRDRIPLQVAIPWAGLPAMP